MECRNRRLAALRRLAPWLVLLLSLAGAPALAAPVDVLLHVGSASALYEYDWEGSALSFQGSVGSGFGALDALAWNGQEVLAHFGSESALRRFSYAGNGTANADGPLTPVPSFGSGFGTLNALAWNGTELLAHFGAESHLRRYAYAGGGGAITFLGNFGSGFGTLDALGWDGETLLAHYASSTSLHRYLYEGGGDALLFLGKIGSGGFSGTSALAMESFSGPSVVPEPGTALLLGAGLLACAGLGRRAS